jgi:integrase-like protein
MPEGRGLFEVVREKIRTRHLALRTEQAYLQWVRRYVNFHHRRHPREMGAAEVEAFLTQGREGGQESLGPAALTLLGRAGASVAIS